MESIHKILDDIESNLYSKSNFIHLTSKETSDYEKGKEQGKLEIITKIRMELEGNAKKESKK